MLSKIKIAAAAIVISAGAVGAFADANPWKGGAIGVAYGIAVLAALYGVWVLMIKLFGANAQ